MRSRSAPCPIRRGSRWSRCCPSRWTTASTAPRRGATGADTTKGRRPGIVELEENLPAGAAGRGRGRAELAPLTSRPPLTEQLVLRVRQPWKPDGKYEVEFR